MLKIMNAVHDEDDIAPLIAMAALGENIERRLLNPTDPFSMMLERARKEFLEAIVALIDTDMTTPAGITHARALQSHAARYRDMCRWISEGLTDGEQAAEELNADYGEQDQAIEELREQIHGKRDKPAPDA